jgi:hypothetical protein
MAAGGQEAALNEAAARMDRSGPFELTNSIAILNAERNPNYNIYHNSEGNKVTVLGVRDSSGV